MHVLINSESVNALAEKGKAEATPGSVRPRRNAPYPRKAA